MVHISARLLLDMPIRQTAGCESLNDTKAQEEQRLLRSFFTKNTPWLSYRVFQYDSALVRTLKQLANRNENMLLQKETKAGPCCMQSALVAVVH